MSDETDADSKILVDRRPYQTAMLVALNDRGPLPIGEIKRIGEEKVDWNEATNAYQVSYKYRVNSARRRGATSPPFRSDLDEQRISGRKYMISKFFDQMKSRGLLEKRKDGLYEITVKGKELVENPALRGVVTPYMITALKRTYVELPDPDETDEEDDTD